MHRCEHVCVILEMLIECKVLSCEGVIYILFWFHYTMSQELLLYLKCFTQVPPFLVPNCSPSLSASCREWRIGQVYDRQTDENHPPKWVHTRRVLWIPLNRL